MEVSKTLDMFGYITTQPMAQDFYNTNMEKSLSKSKKWSYLLTLHALACIEKSRSSHRNSKYYATGTWTPLKRPSTMLNWFEWTNSTTGKCAPLETVKSWNRGELQPSRKNSSLQTNYGMLLEALWAKLNS